MSMSRTRALVGDTVALAFGTLGGSLVGVLMLPLYTRTLTSVGFGTVDLMVTALGLVLPVLFLSVAEAVLRFSMSRGERTSDVLRTALTFVGGVSTLLVLAAVVVTKWLPWPEVALGTSILVVQSVNLVFGAWSRGTARVRVFALSGVVQAVTVGAANVLFLLVLGLAVRGFLLSLLVGNVAGAVVLLLRLPIGRSLAEAAFDWSLLRRMLLFSAPLVPSAIMWWLMNISGRYVLALTHGVGSVGVFGVAARVPALVTMVTTVFAQAWQLSANRSAEDDEEAGRGSFYSGVFRYYAALLFLSVSTVVLVLRPLLRIAAGPAFQAAWLAVPPLLVGAMFSALAAFYGGIYTAAHASGGIFRTTIAAGVGSIVLNALLIPPFGFMGAAVSIALCFMGLWLLLVVRSQRLTRTTVSPRLFVPGAILLSVQISLQYLGLPAGVLYPTMAVVWLTLIVLFRSEIREIGRRTYGILAWARSSGVPTPDFRR
jgi:O-antigen/teichoic acid export membrane protein